MFCTKRPIILCWECRAQNLEKAGREKMKEEWRERWGECYSGWASGLDPGIRWQPNQPRLWWCRTRSLLTAHESTVRCVHVQHISMHTRIHVYKFMYSRWALPAVQPHAHAVTWMSYMSICATHITSHMYNIYGCHINMCIISYV